MWLRHFRLRRSRRQDVSRWKVNGGAVALQATSPVSVVLTLSTREGRGGAEGYPVFNEVKAVVTRDATSRYFPRGTRVSFRGRKVDRQGKAEREKGVKGKHQLLSVWNFQTLSQS